MAAGAAQQEMINQMVAGAVEAMEASVDAVSFLFFEKYLFLVYHIPVLYLIENFVVVIN